MPPCKLPENLPPPRRRLIAVLLLSHVLPCGAELYWRGDFETGDLSQWSGLLHPQGIGVSERHTGQGRYAAHITVTGEEEYWWNENPSLNRVELNYTPPSERTAEGADVYFGWRFMLPELLSENTRHEFGYWESAPDYRQMMRFDFKGDSIGFQVNSRDGLLWEETGAIQPDRWHDVAMHVHWSADAEKGRVSVWFDGEQVVDNARAQTRPAGSEAMFIQLGILRDAVDKVEEIYIDDAREASDIGSLFKKDATTEDTEHTE